MRQELNQNDTAQEKRRMPVHRMVLLDIALYAVCLGLFFLFDYILPQRGAVSGTVVATENSEAATFALPDDTAGSAASVQDGSATNEADTAQTSDTADSGAQTAMEAAADMASGRSMSGRGFGGKNTGNTGTTEITANTTELAASEVTTTTVQKYSGDRMQFTITKNVYGSGNETVTYYAADVYVTSVSELKTAFASGTYGKNIKDTVLSMASENDAVLAISGDFYGNSEEGIVIRNGMQYRSNLNDADICVLFQDGTMKTYAPEDFDAEAVIAAGAWQAWTFGPALLDGSGGVLPSFNTTTYLNQNNPRCALGYVAPGHYVFVVVDGREQGYSRGVNLTELAEIMRLQGCQTAYNLDGGKSAAMVYQGEYVNQPADGGRAVSDCIYVGG